MNIVNVLKQNTKLIKQTFYWSVGNIILCEGLYQWRYYQLSEDFLKTDSADYIYHNQNEKEQQVLEFKKIEDQHNEMAWIGTMNIFCCFLQSRLFLLTNCIYTMKLLVSGQIVPKINNKYYNQLSSLIEKTDISTMYTFTMFLGFLGRLIII